MISFFQALERLCPLYKHHPQPTGECLTDHFQVNFQVMWCTANPLSKKNMNLANLFPLYKFSYYKTLVFVVNVPPQPSEQANQHFPPQNISLSWPLRGKRIGVEDHFLQIWRRLSL